MATVLNASFTVSPTAANPNPNRAENAVRAAHYQITTTTLDGGDVVLLDPHLMADTKIKPLYALVRMTNDAASTLACTIGYGTYIDGVYTAVDADFFAASVNFETEGPTIYYPPDGVQNTYSNGGGNDVIAVTLGGSTSNFAFTAEITLFYQL